MLFQSLLQDVQKVCHNLITSAIANIDLKERFQPSADISGQTTVKSSIQRGIRSAILSSWKIDVETLEEIWPKKESIVHVKWSVASVFVKERFAFHISIITDPTAEIISPSTRCTASPSFSSISTGHISPPCAFSTNASRRLSLLLPRGRNADRHRRLLFVCCQIRSSSRTSASTAARSDSSSRART